MFQGASKPSIKYLFRYLAALHADTANWLIATKNDASVYEVAVIIQQGIHIE